MASETQFYGLQKLAQGDGMEVNGYAFTNKNPDKIDSLLHRALNHDHSGTEEPIDNPVAPPSLILDTEGGSIPAGVTVRYKFTLVDPYGAESAASPEASVATTPQVAAPGAPSLSTAATGGTLYLGNYFYALTAYVGTTTEETILGAKAFITAPTGSTNANLITLPSLPAGATGFNVYRRAPGEAVYSYLDSVDMDVATPPSSYEDDGGTAPNCNRQAPGVNQTNATNSVTVVYPGATPVVPEGYTWKIYRTYQASQYTNSLLHWVVEETAEDSGIITTEYVDVGAGTAFGTPPTTSEIVAGPGQIDLNDATDVEGSLPPYRNVIPHQVTFAQGGVLSTGEGTFVWVCEFDEAEIQYVRASLGRDFVPDATDVIIDINKYDANAATPTWESIFDPGDRPRVLVGESFGEPAEPIPTVKLLRGDALTLDIDQVGGGAGTDADLTVNVFLIARSTGLISGAGPEESYVWS